jgi:DNA-binding transcriptional LysR family regulator
MRKLKDINWNQVYYFYEVARKMSMKEAAEVTGVSIPTVSEQIKRLETLLEVPLFYRRPRRLELTPEGETLFYYAKQMFESGLRFLDVVSPHVIGGYPVRIGLQESFASSAGVDFLLRYYDIYSPFGTVCTERENSYDPLLKRIEEGSLDWGLTLKAPTSERLDFEKISAPEIVFAASPEVCARFPNQADLFQALPLARSRFDESLNKLVTDHLQSEDIFPEEIIESDHWDFCLRLAEEGKCILAASRNLLDQRVALSKLKIFTVGGGMEVSYYAVWRSASHRMIAIRKLIEILEKENKLNPRRSRIFSASTFESELGLEPAPPQLPRSFDQGKFSQ